MLLGHIDEPAATVFLCDLVASPPKECEIHVAYGNVPRDFERVRQRSAEVRCTDGDAIAPCQRNGLETLVKHRRHAHSATHLFFCSSDGSHRSPPNQRMGYYLRRFQERSKSVIAAGVSATRTPAASSARRLLA